MWKANLLSTVIFFFKKYKDGYIDIYLYNLKVLKVVTEKAETGSERLQFLPLTRSNLSSPSPFLPFPVDIMGYIFIIFTVPPLSLYGLHYNFQLPLFHYILHPLIRTFIYRLMRKVVA